MNTEQHELLNKYEEALRKARMSTFTQGTNDAESGTITYNFRLR